MASINEILEASKPRQHKVKVCVNGDLIVKQHELEEQLEEARREDEWKNRKAEAPKIAKQIDALQQEAEKSTYEFVFQAVGQRKWNDLIAKHPPTADQKKQAKANNERADFNVETFPIAAIAASAVDPELTESDVEKLFDAWNFTQWNKLWNGCLEANLGDSSLPKSGIASLVLGRIDKKSKAQSE